MNDLWSFAAHLPSDQRRMGVLRAAPTRAVDQWIKTMISAPITSQNSTSCHLIGARFRFPKNANPALLMDWTQLPDMAHIEGRSSRSRYIDFERRMLGKVMVFYPPLVQ